MKIAIYGSRRQDDYMERLNLFLTKLGKDGADVIMHRKLYNYLLHYIPLALSAVRRVSDTPGFSADVAISIGGDGTFLRTAMWVADKEIPILGINTGHLGYLAGANVNDLDTVTEDIASGKFMIEKRSLIMVEAEGLEGWKYALNEVAVAKEDTSSMITAHALINGRELASYKADGLIVSTPTGSTAYNLSVGGPILQPTAPVWAISPIAAHSLSMRPLVVADDNEITVTVNTRARSFRISLDGRSSTLPEGSTIVLRRAPFVVNVLQRDGHGFPEALRNKMRWGLDQMR